MSEVGGAKRIRGKLAEVLDIPKDVVMNLPRVVLVGRLQLQIENHKGIIQYDPSVVRIRTASGTLRVDGSNLLLDEISVNCIAVRGGVRGIQYEPGGEAEPGA